MIQMCKHIQLQTDLHKRPSVLRHCSCTEGKTADLSKYWPTTGDRWRFLLRHFGNRSPSSSGKDATVLWMEFRWGAHLPFPGHWACRWVYQWVHDAWRLPSQPQSINALETNLYCLVNRGTCVWTTCPELIRKAERPGVEPATSWLQVLCPNHYTTMPHTCTGIVDKPVKWCVCMCVCSPLTEKSEEAISRASIASSTVRSLSFLR